MELAGKIFYIGLSSNIFNSFQSIFFFCFACFGWCTNGCCTAEEESVNLIYIAACTTDTNDIKVRCEMSVFQACVHWSVQFVRSVYNHSTLVVSSAILFSLPFLPFQCFLFHWLHTEEFTIHKYHKCIQSNAYKLWSYILLNVALHLKYIICRECVHVCGVVDFYLLCWPSKHIYLSN